MQARTPAMLQPLDSIKIMGMTGIGVRRSVAPRSAARLATKGAVGREIGSPT